jgi:ion channel POLLUX/CASTOR
MGTSTKQLLRYRFDNLMARGAGAQILLLGVATLVLITVTAFALQLYGGIPDDEGSEESFGRLVWVALMHTLDAGTVAGETGAWAFLFIMLTVTFGGVFIFSALIGVLNNGFGNLIEGLRRGRSPVIERGHTVILGWSAKVQTLLRELAVAGANQRDACVVILADRDKVEMDEELRGLMVGSRRLRVVTRRGSSMDLGDLRLACLETCKAIVVLPPDDCGAAVADAMVLKTLMALAKLIDTKRIHVVAELQDEATETVARIVAGPEAALVVSPPLISRLLVQTGRQSGLSVIYTELLDFGGAEIYLQLQPELLGKRFRDAVFAYDDSTLLGVLTADDQVVLLPDPERRFVVGDQVIAISEDDDTVVLNGEPQSYPDEHVIASPPAAIRQRERTLVLGASERLLRVLRELDAYVASGSETLVVGESPAIDAIDPATLVFEHSSLTCRRGDITRRDLLDQLAVESFDNVLVLSETEGRSQELADARTMITLLQLRDLLRKLGKNVPITSEILEIANRDLAAVAEADDFIVSNTLVSLLIAQVSENRHLVRVFEELFSPGGSEIYLKPAREYVALDVELPFAAICEAALRRGELAIGIRRAAHARDEAQAFGVVINPRKRAPMRLADGDRVIVLASD